MGIYLGELSIDGYQPLSLLSSTAPLQGSQKSYIIVSGGHLLDVWYVLGVCRAARTRPHDKLHLYIVAGGPIGHPCYEVKINTK